MHAESKLANLSLCILQVKLPNGNRGGALCPYCKAEFSVMFRGAQTAEERAASHAEEQRITEATLRAREVISQARSSALFGSCGDQTNPLLMEYDMVSKFFGQDFLVA